MSGTSYDSTCPRCGGIMSCYSDWKPYDCVSGDCLECGFTYCTQEWQRTLEELNELRAEWELEPLPSLREAGASPSCSTSERRYCQNGIQKD
jgi:hypothetical protein